MSQFKRAQRKQAKLKLAITGPTGSGKTYSALRLFKGFGGKTALIDTENGSASLYDDFEFDTCEITPPFTTEKYIKAIRDAIESGYDNLIIDSLSHAWSGEGGILSRKEDFDSQRGGNSYANWRMFTKEQEAFVTEIVQAPINMICTMRSKIEYVLESTDKGKMAPKKMGTKPIQRDNVEYEFTTVFDVQSTHKCSVSKDRTNLFRDAIFQITEETGSKLRDWLSGAKPVSTVSQDEEKNYISKINEMKLKIKDPTKLQKIDEAIASCTKIGDLKNVANRLEKTVSMQ